MNRPTVDDDRTEGEDLGTGLGLRPESRVERRELRRKQRARRGLGCFAVIISLLVVGSLVAGAVIGFGKGKDALEKVFAAPDYEGNGEGTVSVEITKGQATASIADTLEKKEVVKSAKAFERVAREDPRSRQIQAATYTLRKHMSAKAAFELMLNTAESIRVLRVSVPAGKTKAEVVAILQNPRFKLPAGSAAKAMGNPKGLGLPAYAHANAEGFLAPGTYDVPKGADATAMIKLMTGQYAKNAAAVNFVKTAQAKDIDPYRALIVASIIQSETNRQQDYGKVARVIYNRLAAGMRLQMDSTVHYVAGRDGGVFTTEEQRDIDSPYNTYKYKDLPPTPISSPTKDTMRAAVNPTKGGWLYFTLVNLDTGETAFARTASEHQANVNKLRAWCSANKGRC